MKKISLIQNMSELGAGTRGASLGKDALVMAAHKLGKDLFKNRSWIEVPNFNSELHDAVTNPFAKRIEGILKSAAEAEKCIGKVLRQGDLPMIVSGDHCNAASTIAAIKQAYPDKRLGVIWIDAHGDLHSPYTTPSGNMHGMPLAISLGLDYKKLQRNEPTEDTKSKWNQLKNLGGIAPKIESKDLIFFAVRDVEKIEQEFIEHEGIRNFAVSELRHRGMEQCLKEASEQLADCDLIYISFDVDSMDCNLVSHGTGTPVPDGLTPEEAEEIIFHFVADKRLVCMETVEINPLLDEKGNEMAETTVRILDNVIRKIEA